MAKRILSLAVWVVALGLLVVGFNPAKHQPRKPFFTFEEAFAEDSHDGIGV
jgi:hypothetical protein